MPMYSGAMVAKDAFDETMLTALAGADSARRAPYEDGLRLLESDRARRRR
jgi:hypothetical protein